jgi:hypothetical protein
LDPTHPSAATAFVANTEEGRSRDVSEDIARELLQRANDAGDDLGEGAQHFAQHAPPMQLGAVEPLDRLKADFEKRPPAPSVRRGPALDIRQRLAKPGKY